MRKVASSFVVVFCLSICLGTPSLSAVSGDPELRLSADEDTLTRAWTNKDGKTVYGSLVSGALGGDEIEFLRYKDSKVYPNVNLSLLSEVDQFYVSRELSRLAGLQDIIDHIDLKIVDSSGEPVNAEVDVTANGITIGKGLFLQTAVDGDGYGTINLDQQTPDVIEQALAASNNLLLVRITAPDFESRIIDFLFGKSEQRISVVLKSISFQPIISDFDNRLLDSALANPGPVIALQSEFPLMQSFIPQSLPGFSSGTIVTSSPLTETRTVSMVQSVGAASSMANCSWCGGVSYGGCSSFGCGSSGTAMCYSYDIYPVTSYYLSQPILAPFQQSMGPIRRFFHRIRSLCRH